MSLEDLPSRRVGQKAGFKPVLKMVSMSGGTKCSILYIKINPRVERLARQFGRRRNDVMNSPACFQGLGHYLLSEVAVEFYSWPLPPFDENSQPTNGLAFDDFTARINLNPKVLEAEPPLDQ